MYGSVCSGIEAATVAWEPLGWKAAWLSEIEAFPSAVLAHRFPEVPNLGDMTTIARRVLNGSVPAPDVLTGGTPCQSFSVAGMREGLKDPRGELTIRFVELADAIDHVRSLRGDPPCVVVWENVPGVLSDKDNAFGCFLGALAGEDAELQPAGKRWSDAGCVYGPQRAIAWRILDAQYFGLAQRRRRVFVVASARNGFDPAAVLFEREGVRRDTAPSREAGKESAADAGAGAFSTSGAGFWRDRIGPLRSREQDSHENLAVIPDQKWPAEIASTLNAAFGSKLGLEDQHINGGAPLFVPSAIPLLEPGARTGESTTDPRAGIGIGQDGDPMFTLQAGKQHGVACAVTGDIAHALNTANNGKGCSEDGTGRGVPTIAFSAKDYRGDAMENLSPTLRAGGHSSSHANAGVMPAVTVHGTQDPDVRVDLSHTLGRNSGQENAVFGGLSVRRLTPLECERLQGFPDGHTLIPTGKRNWHREREEMRAYFERTLGAITDDELDRLAADGPRYKAIGNSWAVPVARWVGKRIQDALSTETLA